MSSSRLNGCKIRRDYISDALCISLFHPSPLAYPFVLVFHSVRDVALSLCFTLLVLFRLSQLPPPRERERTACRSPPKNDAPFLARPSAASSLFYFFSSLIEMEAVCPRARSRHVHGVLACIEGDLEMPRRCVRLRARRNVSRET